MKKKWIWIGAIVAVLLVAALIGYLILVNYLRSRPGAHMVGDQLYVDVSRAAFIVDNDTGKCTDGQTPVTVKGYTNEEGIFQGETVVLSYPITESGKITGEPVLVDLGDGFYALDYLPDCTHSEVVDGEMVQKQHFCTYEYRYYFYLEDPDFLIVEVYERTGLGEYHHVVVADSEAQAEEYYQWFRENRP